MKLLSTQTIVEQQPIIKVQVIKLTPQRLQQHKNNFSVIMTTGIAGSSRTEAQRTDSAERNARLNLNKQSIAKGRKPMGSNVKIWNGKEVINVLHKRQ